jgi:anti-sigma B factor antagonist
MEPICLRQDGTTLCVNLSGRLSQDEGAQLTAQAGARLAAEGGGPRDLLLDLSEVEYMTSAAVGSVVGLYQQVRLGGGRMAVAAPDDRVHLLLEIAVLNQLLALRRTAGEARQALAREEPAK